ncbi:MAG: hypothetical protein ABIK28_18705, partial [Planctomycetota bacterium]
LARRNFICEELIELQAEAEDARRGIAPGRFGAAVAEIKTLKFEVAASLGFRGKLRKAGGDAEKILKAVSLAISRAIANIAEPLSELHRRLQDSVKLGMVMAYAPGVWVEWGS